MRMQAEIAFACQTDAGKGSPDYEVCARFLAMHGYNVHYACEKTGPSPLNNVGAPHFKYQVLASSANGFLGSLLRQWRFFRALWKLRWQKPQVFFICEPPMAFVGLVALLGVPKSKVFYQVQDFIDPANHPLRAFIEKLICRRAGLVIVNDACRARFMQSYHRLREAPLVVRTAMLASWPPRVRRDNARRALLGQSSQVKRLVWNQGSFREDRMAAQLLQAMCLLPCKYVLALTQDKSKEERRFLAMAKEMGLEDRLIGVNRMPFNELANYAAAADVGVLLYPNDGIGNFFKAPGRLTQYAACGLPVVASEFPSLENVILKYRLGATCDPYSPESIARAIKAVVEVGSQKQRTRRQRIRRVFKKHLAYEHDGRRLLEAIPNMASR